MIAEYAQTKKLKDLPRFPFQGEIDLTYRCNNNCRHCWLWVPSNAAEKKRELNFEELTHIITVARQAGCSRWNISGGEPMFRQDFTEIFDFITRNSSYFHLNTNGTLITPKIAKLMKRNGSKMVALYGATAQVHDYITRNPGSFALMMRGMRYLKEAGASFTVQIIPMRSNYHQLQKMLELAESLSKNYRIGAIWLHFSSTHNPERNQGITDQRLTPQEAIRLDPQDFYSNDLGLEEGRLACRKSQQNDYFFGNCIPLRRNFHIDPYGKMSFCSFVKDPKLRFDLKKGNFQQGWDEFIPSLAKKVRFTQEYRAHCRICALKEFCLYCPAYGYLEHRRYGRKIDYLCALADEQKELRREWIKDHRRTFRIADLSIQVDYDLPINERTFDKRFKIFQSDSRENCDIRIKHHFFLPRLKRKSLGEEVYRRRPWVIYKKGNSFVYVDISSKKPLLIAVFNQEHTLARIYNRDKDFFLRGGLYSISLFATDQILLARILADRQGCYLHSCGVNWKGRGALFIGNSGAGKTTMARFFKNKAEILCDDRIIVRLKEGNFKIYGTWNHGDIPDVSANSAPLAAIFFLDKAKKNRIIPLTDKKEVARRLLSCLIIPFVTADWWEKTVFLLEKMIEKTPCYILQFEKNKRIISLLKKRLF